MRFRFVEAEQAQFPVSRLCKAVGVTRGGSMRGSAEHQQAPSRGCWLLEQIRQIHTETSGYGAPGSPGAARRDPGR